MKQSSGSKGKQPIYKLAKTTSTLSPLQDNSVTAVTPEVVVLDLQTPRKVNDYSGSNSGSNSGRSSNKRASVKQITNKVLIVDVVEVIIEDTPVALPIAYNLVSGIKKRKSYRRDFKLFIINKARRQALFQLKDRRRVQQVKSKASIARQYYTQRQQITLQTKLEDKLKATPRDSFRVPYARKGYYHVLEYRLYSLIVKRR